MCVIIHKPKGINFSDEDIANAYRTNSHGFGLMYYDDKEKKIVAKKGLVDDIPTIQKIFHHLKDKEVAFHFRIKTHGPTNGAMCHPFQVLNKTQHGHDMWMMHNGVIRKANPKENESDTYAFIRDSIRNILAADPDLIYDPGLEEFIVDYIGHSKLVFLNDRGEFIRINSNMGGDYKGCWVSNKVFVPYTRTNYSYTKPSTSTAMTIIGTPKKETTLRQKPIHKGDKVFVFATRDPDFIDVGVVDTVFEKDFFVEFKNTEGALCRLLFDTDGSSCSSVTPTEWQVVPISFGISPEFKYFELTDDWPTATTEDEMDVNENGEVLDTETEDKVEETNDETASDDIPEDWLIAVEHYGDPQIEFTTTGTVKIKQYAKDYRYGGINQPDALTVYGGQDGSQMPETTLLDIHNMDFQDRLDWFMCNIHVAFAIFQDLLEWTILDDDQVITESEAIEQGLDIEDEEETKQTA